MKEHIMGLVRAEVRRQEVVWGSNDTDRARQSDTLWNTVLGEEFGEVCRAVCERDIENLKVELIQVAATAISHYEALETREGVKW